MNKILPSAAVFAAILAPGAAWAQEVEPFAETMERAIVFEGEAARACLIESPTADSQVNTSLERAGNGVNVTLSPTGFLDPQTGVPRQTGISLSLPITCNTAHQLRVASRSGALIRAGATAGGATGPFRSELDFDVEVNWAGQTRAFNTANATQVLIPVPDAATGQASVTISIPGGGTPLAAGDYGDTLVIEVEASS